MPNGTYNYITTAGSDNLPQVGGLLDGFTDIAPIVRCDAKSSRPRIVVVSQRSKGAFAEKSRQCTFGCKKGYEIVASLTYDSSEDNHSRALVCCNLVRCVVSRDRCGEPIVG